MAKSLDLVSIIIPCYNEEEFIAKCLDSILRNGYPEEALEILVVDGMSEDRTREIVETYSQKYPLIRLVDNRKKITPVALNIGIRHAKGDIIMRMDAHASYENGYISKCVKYMDEYGADLVGGTMVTTLRDGNPMGRFIARALSHRFGVGGSVFRTGSKEPKWVDTVFGGSYRREVFDKVGLFNEDLARGQDMEFNLRLRSAGGKILLHPDIVCYYYPRSDFRSFCRDNLKNGLWAIYPFKFADHMPVSWRHLVPLVFVLSLAGSALLSVISQAFLWLFLFIVGSYVLANVYFSIKISAKEKNLGCLFVMPLIFATLHVNYGLGSLCGLLKVIASVRFWKNRFGIYSGTFDGSESSR